MDEQVHVQDDGFPIPWVGKPGWVKHTLITSTRSNPKLMKIQ